MTVTQSPAAEPAPVPGATDPAVLRQRAGQKANEAQRLRWLAQSLDSDARQLAHQAGLWEIADAAEDAVCAIHGKGAPLEAAVGQAVTAARQADDHLRKAKSRLAAAKGAEARADEKTDLEASEDAAARVAKAEKNTAAAQAACAVAQQVLGAAESALDAHRKEMRDADAAFSKATAAAMNPGSPGLPSVWVELKPDGPDPLIVPALRSYVMRHGILDRPAAPATPERNPQVLSGPGFRDQLRQADPTKPVFIRHGGRTEILPPRVNTGR